MFQRFGQDTFAEKKRLIALLRMIWLCFVLLIGEGALRKWIVSSLGAPLLVIRDLLLQMIAVGQLDSVRSGKNAQPI